MMDYQFVKIYGINLEHHELDPSHSNTEKINRIINLIRKRAGVNVDRIQGDIFSKTKNGLSFYLYHHDFVKEEIDWSDFFPDDLYGSKSRGSSKYSMLLFIDDGNFVYCTIGGLGYPLIKGYLNHKFGIEIASKLIEPVEDKISRIKSRGLTGMHSGSQSQFRRDIRVIDYVKFGKIPVEVDITLNKDTSKLYFSFLQENPEEELKIQVGKAFKIRRKISYDELHNVVEQLGYIMQLEARDSLTTFEHITLKKEIDSVYMPMLVGKIFDDRTNIAKNYKDSRPKFEFDFCEGSKPAEFYAADRYILETKDNHRYVQFDEVFDKDHIYNGVVKYGNDTIDDMSLFNFTTYLRRVRIKSMIDNEVITKTNFLYHFSAELKNNYGQSIFVIDNQWYHLKNAFLKELTEDCERFVRKDYLRPGIFDKPWDLVCHRKENDYNNAYFYEDDEIVLDTITPDYVELCDVLIFRDNILYLVHVKKGFDGKMRELSNQITLSARRLYSDLRTKDKPYLKRVFSSFKKSPVYNGIEYAEFANMFTRKIIYVFAFRPNDNQLYDIRSSLNQYRSNIAKFSLVQVSREIKIYDFDLRIKQIEV